MAPRSKRGHSFVLLEIIKTFQSSFGIDDVNKVGG